MESLQQSLKKLTELEVHGVISKAEYEARRQQLLDSYLGLVPATSTTPDDSSSGSGWSYAPSVPQLPPVVSGIAGCPYPVPLPLYPGLFLTHPRKAERTLQRAKQGSSTVKVQPVPPGTPDETMVALFSKFGEVQSAAVKQGSPTYAYVNFCSPEASQAAAAAGGVEIGGILCTINLAKRQHRQAAESPPSNGLGMFNLPYSTTQQELQGILCQYEGFRAVKMIHRKAGEFRGYAFAYFDTVDQASTARALLQGLIIADQQVDVKFSNQSSEEALGASATDHQSL